MTNKKKSIDDILDSINLPSDEEVKHETKHKKQAESIRGRVRKDQSARMTGDNNIMAGKVSPNRGKAMPQIAEKITGIKRSEETKKQIGATRKAKGLTNTWTGVDRPEQSNLMRDPSRNKGAQYMRETLTCPHCGKTANGPNYKRWHGDNCKHK